MGCAAPIRPRSLPSKLDGAFIRTGYGLGKAGIDEDMALRRGDEETREAMCADEIEVVGDAERFGGPLPAPFCCVQPPADEYQREKSRQSQEDYRPISLRRLGQLSLSQF